MGDIRKQRKKYSKPGHPWNKERILAEQEIAKEYGLKRKKEIWKMNSVLSSFARQAKELIAKDNPIKQGQLLRKLTNLGLLKEGASVEDVLAIKLNDIMERRLQTIVFRKKLSRSINQARQFIVHEHIVVGDKKITVPSYLISVAEESTVRYSDDSPVANPEHPERFVEKKPEKKSDKEEKKETKEKPKKEDKVKKEDKKEEPKKDEKKTEDKK